MYRKRGHGSSTVLFQMVWVMDSTLVRFLCSESINDWKHNLYNIAGNHTHCMQLFSKSMCSWKSPIENITFVIDFTFTPNGAWLLIWILNMCDKCLISYQCKQLRGRAPWTKIEHVLCVISKFQHFLEKQYDYPEANCLRNSKMAFKF